MRGLIAVSGLVLAGALLAGCQDNSGEVEKLRSDLTAQQKRFDEANDRWASERDTMRAELADLKKQMGTLPEGEARPVAARISELEAQLAEGDNAANEELAAKVDALGKKIDGVKEEAVEAARVEAAKAGSGSVSAEDLAKAMAEEQAKNAPTKDLAAAMDRLQISQAEKDQIKQHIIDSKQQILETLEVPTEDGRVFAEELLDTFIKIQNGDGKMTDVHALFIELSSKKIPGDIEGRTYAQAIDAVKARNKEDIGRILSPADQEKLTAAHEDWTDFDIGEGDPWGALYMERLQKAQAEKE